MNDAKFYYHVLIALLTIIGFSELVLLLIVLRRRKSAVEIGDTKRSGIMDRAGVKVLENLVSVKMWGLFIFTAISTWLCWNGKVSGSDWTYGNATVYSIVYGVREISKQTIIKNSVTKQGGLTKWVHL